MSLSQEITVSLRRLLQVVVLFLATASLQAVRAETNTPSGTLPLNRFLLIIETSHAMQRRTEGTLRTINNLIATRMRGQLHLGDSIGVWTFNETLSTGKLPVQEWSEGERGAIAGKIFNFVQEQKYEKQPRLDKLLPALLQVVKKSEFITVILISEGSQDFQGTPFDQKINQSYKQWGVQQQKARMPLVTVLRAQHGQFSGYSVTPAPFPVELPPLPVELVRPKSPPSLPVVASPKPAPPPIVPSLIISGRKHEPPPVILPATDNNLAAHTPALVTNSPPATQLAEVKQPDLPLTSTVPIVSNTLSSDPASPGAVAAPLSSPLAQPIVTTLAPPAPKLSNEPSPPASSLPSQTTEPTRDNALSNSEAGNRGAVPSSSSVPGTEIATTSAAPASPHGIFIALGLLLAGSAAWVALWLWKRRTRPAAHTSLITRSLDRDRH